MKKLFYLFVLTLVTSCSNYGEKLEFNGTEVYYKDGVTKEQAEKLGVYLQAEGFTDGNKKSVQLVNDKNTNNLTFRMVTSKGSAYNPQNETMFESFTRNLTQQFEQPVDFQLCDESFETLRTFKASDVPALIEKGNLQVLYTKNVTEEQAQNLTDFLTKDEKETAMTVLLDQRNDTLVYKMVVKAGYQNNEAYTMVLKAYKDMMSKEVFNNQVVEVQMCDEKLKTLKVIN